jgi:DNA-binding CsgD family transcriptional regulator
MAACLERARCEIAGLLDDPPPGARLADRAVLAVGRVVGHDGYCLFGVDPTTGLRSVMFSRHGLSVPTEVLMRNETVDRDANRYVDLARAAVPVGVLSRVATPRSSRLHEILPGDGYHSELRVALTSPGRYWGAMSLFRGDGGRPFDDRDVEAARELAPWLGQVLRRYQVGRAQAHPPTTATTSVLCLDAHNTVVGMDADARASLALFGNHWADGVLPEDMMRCVHEVADAARRDAPALARTRISDGRWLVVTGSHVGASTADVVVQLRSADVGTVLPAFAAWCGLSAREVDVLRLLMQGLAPKQVARQLAISALTVGDHQRSLYRKAGVHGRDELVSLLV